MDDIRRKLAFIDKQLAGGIVFQKRIIGTAPLLLVAIGLIVGILIESTADWPAGLWLTADTVFMLTASVFNGDLLLAIPDGWKLTRLI